MIDCILHLKIFDLLTSHLASSSCEIINVWSSRIPWVVPEADGKEVFLVEGVFVDGFLVGGCLADACVGAVVVSGRGFVEADAGALDAGALGGGALFTSLSILAAVSFAILDSKLVPATVSFSILAAVSTFSIVAPSGAESNSFPGEAPVLADAVMADAGSAAGGASVLPDAVMADAGSAAGAGTDAESDAGPDADAATPGSPARLPGGVESLTIVTVLGRRRQCTNNTRLLA
jgi:hypothetical protein